MLVLINKHIWNRWMGPSDEFSLEQRIFHAILLILLPLLLISSIFDFIIGLEGMALYLLVTLVCQVLAFYLSRVKKKNTIALILFACNGYSFLIINYYLNSGIQGPTLLLFLLTFMAVLVVSPKVLNRYWAVLHFLIAVGLLWMEYRDPSFIEVTYSNRLLFFADIIFSYGCSLVIVYGITTYIKFNYTRERKLAMSRAEINATQKEQLEKIDEQKNRLFSIIGHDVRGPLMLIRGYLDLLEHKESMSGSESEELRQQLQESVDGTIEMLENLLEWSRLQYRQETQLEQVDITASIDKVLVLLEKQAAKKEVVIKRLLPETKTTVPGNKRILELVFRNVVQNAIKFTSSNGVVTVEELVERDFYLIKVKDTGMGMSPEQLASLFSFKVKSTYGTNREKGTGMGLMLCKELLSEIGGTISAESVEKEGSTFVIRLKARK